MVVEPIPLLAPELAQSIRTIPDHPRAGIQFRDVTTLLASAEAFDHALTALADGIAGHVGAVDVVVGIEARGFIVGAALSDRLKVGFVPMRKPGKLPWHTVSESYQLEYGVDELHVHRDAIANQQRVLIADDLLATGGTAGAAVALIRHLGATAVGLAVLVDLPDLGGRARVEQLDVPVLACCEFAGD
jgi:adenine phosphoribosyltransferase